MNKHDRSKPRMIILAAVTGLSLLLSACAPSGIKDLTSGIKSGETKANPVAQQKVADSVTGFSWDLFQATLAQEGNVMISPLSVQVALSMALNGAGGTTLEEMRKTLTIGDLSTEDLNQGMLDWLKSLDGKDAKAKWQVADSLWLHEGYDANPLFLETVKTFYQAEARTLDFSKPASVETINGWVKDKTNGKIDKILEKIGDDVRMYLINAVWFKADWETPFKAASTVPSDFHATSGTIQVPFMNRLGSIDVVTGAHGSGIVLPYTDPRFAFVAILPEEGTTPRELAAGMNMEDLKTLLGQRQTQQVQLALPRFESSFEAEMTPILQSLGMQQAFDAATADFSKMSASGAKELFITAVKHKTYVRVDEKGTEAAAATSVEMGVTSMPASGLEIRFDRPFLYAIVDVENGMPLFLGVMENPAE